MNVDLELSDFVDRTTAEDILDCSRTTLYKLTKSGEIPAYRCAGKNKYRKSELLAYLQGGKRC